MHFDNTKSIIHVGTECEKRKRLLSEGDIVVEVRVDSPFFAGRFIHRSASGGGSLGEELRVSSAEAFSDRHNFSDGDSEGGAGGVNGRGLRSKCIIQ